MLSLLRKDTMIRVVYETTKVNVPNLLRGRQTTASFIEQWFKKPSLTNKKE